MKKNTKDYQFVIVNEIAVLSVNDSGWKKELNVIKWNDGEPKFDIRTWNEDHTKMGKGITLDSLEVAKLIAGLMEVTK